MGRIRLERLNSLIAETVAELLQKRSKDPRLAPVTISRAEVAPNLQSAKILYGVLGGDKEREEAAKALEKARGFLRSALFEALTIKRVPELRFELDRNTAHAARVSEVLAIIKDSESPAGAAESSPEDSSDSHGSAPPDSNSRGSDDHKSPPKDSSLAEDGGPETQGALP